MIEKQSDCSSLVNMVGSLITSYDVRYDRWRISMPPRVCRTSEVCPVIGYTSFVPIVVVSGA